MEVTLYAIAKNEEKNIEKFIENSKKFSHTVVVDTGSTDNTVQLLRDAGIKVYEHPQTREDFDFSVARNQALSYVETDWAFSLDFNEDITDFFPEGLEVISEEFTTFKHERYDKVDENEPTQSNEVHVRFHRTKNYIWSNAVHETPVFVPTENFLNEVAVDTTIKITKQITKSVDKQLFYLSICEREYEKDKNNWYYLWFIFNHYYSVKNASKTLEYGQEFLNITKPYFHEFRIQCFIICSSMLLVSGDINKAANYAFHALSEAMNFGGQLLGNAFMHLMKIGQITDNPNIVIFASGFNPDTLRMQERTDAIDKLIINSTNKITIPISVGELIDKITILEIKSSVSNNEYIQKELNELNKIKSTISYNISEYEIELKKINQKLWDIEDRLREKEKIKEFDTEFTELARSVYITNDERAKIKSKINDLTESVYKELKLYK